MDVDEGSPSGFQTTYDDDKRAGSSGGAQSAEPQCTPAASAADQPKCIEVLDSPDSESAHASANDSKLRAASRDLPTHRESGHLKRCKPNFGSTPASCRPLVFGTFVAPSGLRLPVDASSRRGGGVQRTAAAAALVQGPSEGARCDRDATASILTSTSNRARHHGYGGGPTAAVHAVRYVVPSPHSSFHRTRNQENVPPCGHAPTSHGPSTCFAPSAAFPRPTASNFLQHRVSLPTQTCHHGKPPPCFSPAHFVHAGRTAYVGTPHPASRNHIAGRRTPPLRSAGAAFKTLPKGLYQIPTYVFPPSGQSTPVARTSLNSSGEEDTSPADCTIQVPLPPGAQRPQQEQPPPQTDHASVAVTSASTVVTDAIATAASSSSSSSSLSPSCSTGDNSATANVPLRQVLGPLDNHSSLLFASPFTEAASRQHHNAKERMRRSRIKESCQLMRELIPGMTDKTDKATVFEYATQYILYIKQIIGTKYDRDFLQKYSPY